MTILPRPHPSTREADRTTDTVADRVTSQGAVTPLVGTRGPVPAHIQGQDHAQDPRHLFPENLANRPGTSEGKANEKLWTLNSSAMATST
jgi:hypothetical protein